MHILNVYYIPLVPVVHTNQAIKRRSNEAYVTIALKANHSSSYLVIKLRPIIENLGLQYASSEKGSFINPTEN